MIDKRNRKTGVGEKIKIHKEGSLHRAFSIFIFNNKKEILLQQRAKNKYHSPLLWSNTVCGHPRPGETFLQGAYRRLREEMGINCRLKKLFCFIYNAGFKNGLIENEYDCVFIGKFNGKPNLNKAEVMKYKWVPLGFLKKDIINNKYKYSIWLEKALSKIKARDISRIIK